MGSGKNIQQSPCELEIEQEVLSLILSYPDQRAVAFEQLSVDHFYSTSHQVIFEKCRELEASSQPIGINTVWAAFTKEQREIVNSANKLSSLVDQVPPAIEITHSAKILKDRKARRESIKHLNVIEKKIHNNCDLSEVLNEAQKIIDEVEYCANQSAEETCISLSEIYTEKLEEKPIIKGLLYENDQTVFYAPGGVGKSLILQDIAMALGANFKSLWGGLFEIPKPRNTLFIQSENSREAVNIRTFKKCAGNKHYIAGLENVQYAQSFGNIQVAGPVSNPGFRKKIVRYTKTAEDQNEFKIDLIVFDPLISYHDAEENDNSRMRSTLDQILQIANEIESTPLVIHHANKEGGLRGATAILDWARNIIKLEDASYQGEKRIKFTHEKVNNGEMFGPFTLAMDEYLNFSKVEYADTLPKNIRDRCLKVREALVLLKGNAEKKNDLIEQYKDMTGIKADRTLHRHIDEAVKNNFIGMEYYTEGGSKKRYSKYFLP